MRLGTDLLCAAGQIDPEEFAPFDMARDVVPGHGGLIVAAVAA